MEVKIVRKEIFGTTFAKVLSAVGLVCSANKVGDAVLLQQLDVRVHRHILKIEVNILCLRMFCSIFGLVVWQDECMVYL